MRNINIYTGAGGMDIFEEALQWHLGIRRIYIGKKVPRILRRLKTTIRKSPYTDRYYKIIGKIEVPVCEYRYTSYIAQ